MDVNFYLLFLVREKTPTSANLPPFHLFVKRFSGLKNRRGVAFFAQILSECALFWAFFASISTHVSTSREKKSTPNFSAALTFSAPAWLFVFKMS